MAANNKGREEKNNPREQSGALENESNLRSNASSKNKDSRREDESSDTRTRKPGSQGNSSKQGNNGRGGGK